MGSVERLALSISNVFVYRSMGGDMSEASEFDRVMQSMSEGTYQSSSAMETFPVCWNSVGCL